MKFIFSLVLAGTVKIVFNLYCLLFVLVLNKQESNVATGTCYTFEYLAYLQIIATVCFLTNLLF